VTSLNDLCNLRHHLRTDGVQRDSPAAQRPSPLDIFGNFTPTVQGLHEFSLFSAYVSQSLAGSYNPPLWTMFYEFLGSFMVFATVAILRPLHLRTCCWDYFLQFLQSTSRAFHCGNSHCRSVREN
jgi:hypothetical protein